MPLDDLLVVLSEHLRTFAGLQELLVVSLQPLDEAAILLGAHLGQLQRNKERIMLGKKTQTGIEKEKKTSASPTYHAESECVDVIDVLEAVLPRHEALDVDVELVPDVHDGLIILVIPVEEHKNSVSQ